MIQAIVRKGKVIGESIPAPVVSDGGVLVKVVNSCISAGTEISGISASGKSLIKQAMKQPEKVRKTLNMARSEGIIATYDAIRGRLDSGTPTGYSVSGMVIGVGKKVQKFNIGDKVAAAGAGIANHAEYVDVPENLVMKMPPGASYIEASTVTPGGIALQGVRRADLRLGEYCVVFGCGILGLLSIQLLKTAGIRVAAIDLDEKRLAIAKELGAERASTPTSGDIIESIENWSGSHGADAVIFTAATNQSEPLSQSFRMCRRKGRVILVGVSGMDIKREDIYQKELDFLISTSYGPGRYDASYEEKGIDYPYSYVRWTENRNMEEYLRLVSKKHINLEKLISAVYPIEEVSKAFESLQTEGDKPIMVILDYGMPEKEKSHEYLNHERKISVNINQVKKDALHVALVGAGGFATGMHLPNIRKLNTKYKLYAVVDKNGHVAKAIARNNNASIATTSYEEVIQDMNVDLVMICTRHDSHADLTLRALNAGKHVFVEKPLATTHDDLDKIVSFYDTGAARKPLVFVGFNRRFSRYAQEIKRHTENRINPLFIHYRMNAGYIPLDNWVHEDGGRIVGEACHIIDLMTFFTKSKIQHVTCESLKPGNQYYSESDNKSIILKYEDGSVCTIEYFAVGGMDFPKEYMEVHFDGKTILMDDYKSLRGFNLKIDEIRSSTTQKGHLEELECLYDSLIDTTWPIELWDIAQTTECTFILNS